VFGTSEIITSATQRSTESNFCDTTARDFLSLQNAWAALRSTSRKLPAQGPRSAIHRHYDLHYRTLWRDREKAKFAPEPIGPRDHRLNPEATCLGAPISDSATVVLDAKQKPYAADLDRDIDVRGVTQGIGCCLLLRNPVEIDRYIEGKLAGKTVIHSDRDYWTPEPLDVQLEQR
jgi:hypothetical protein